MHRGRAMTNQITLSDLITVCGGDSRAYNNATGQVGLQMKGVNIGANVVENKNDYRSCLDAIARYGGKVSECQVVHKR